MDGPAERAGVVGVVGSGGEADPAEAVTTGELDRPRERADTNGARRGTGRGGDVRC